MTQSERRTGFTLIEMLVALSIFSVAAMAMLHLAGENVRAAQALEQRAFAQIVAETVAVEATLAPADDASVSGVVEIAGRTMRWERRQSVTADPDLLRVDVAVQEDGAEQTVATMTIFRKP